MKTNNVALLCFLTMIAGCGKPARDPQAGEPAVPQAKHVPEPKSPEQVPPPTKPAVEKRESSGPAKTTTGLSTKELAYRDGVLKFVEESRSVLRLLDLIPSEAAYKKRMEKLQEDFIRIPDPPESMKELHEMVKSIFLSFGEYATQLANVEKLLRLDAKKESIVIAGYIKESIASTNEVLNKLEEVLK